jgi:hypothetical protein
MPSPDYRAAVHMDMYCLTFSRGWQQKNAAFLRNKPFVKEAGRRISRADGHVDILSGETSLSR